MISSSLSILSSTSSFPFNSNTDLSSSSSSIRPRVRPFYSFQRSHSFPKPLSFAIPRASLNQPVEDGSVEQFLQNNSIADFMRFKRGVDGGCAELQTAVVRYRKRFPWSLLRPFLQVQAGFFYSLQVGVGVSVSYVGCLIGGFLLFWWCRLIWFRRFTLRIKSMSTL
jgi:hypothetical protein